MGYYDRDRNPRSTSTGLPTTDPAAAGTMNHPMTHYGNTAEFLVSGWPYLGEFKNNNATTQSQTITFTHVTQHITVSAFDGDVSFSVGGGAATMTIPAGTISPRLDVKIAKITFTLPAGATVSFVAGLTNVPYTELPDMSTWTGVSANPNNIAP
ncbi:MAG: hypothetical protein VXZ58_06435 [Actinomycetota bacterium]|nr:hypothetical protein [Actinomycetota bacterium]